MHFVIIGYVLKSLKNRSLSAHCGAGLKIKVGITIMLKQMFFLTEQKI